MSDMRSMRNFLILGLAISAVSSAIILNAGTEKEFSGIMEYDNEHEGIFLMTLEGLERVNLDFAYDNESDLVVEDFGYVNVKGRYINLLNILKVEEIDESTELPVLCYIGNNEIE